jgi:hypothetical protein
MEERTYRPLRHSAAETVTSSKHVELKTASPTPGASVKAHEEASLSPRRLAAVARESDRNVRELIRRWQGALNPEP